MIDLNPPTLDQPPAVIDLHSRGEVPRRAARPVGGVEAVDLDLEPLVVRRKNAFTEVVVIGAGFDEAISLDHGRIAHESAGLAVEHADEQDEEASMKDDARDLGPERAVALRRGSDASPRGRHADEHAGAD